MTSTNQSQHRPPPRHRPRPAAPRSHPLGDLAPREVAIIAVVIAAGIGAATASGAPTGLSVWDAVLRVALAAVVTMAASRSRRWIWFLFSGVGIVLASEVLWAAVAAAGLIPALATARSKRRDRLAGAIVGATGIQALLRLRSVGFFGSSSLIAAAVIIPLIWLGYSYTRGPGRKWIRRITAGLAAVVAVIATITLAGVLSVRTDAERGVSAARAGLDAAREGDQDRAVERLEAAERALSDANGTAGAWWMKPARLVPVAGQHAAVLDDLTDVGADVSSAAAVAATTADIDDLRASGGAVDLDLVQSMRTPLETLESSLLDAKDQLDAVQSPWIVGMVQDRIDSLNTEIDEALPDAIKATDAIDALPALLGGGDRVRYLVIFATPSEARELGGILGNWIELEISDGRVRITDEGRNDDLIRRGPGTIADPSQYPARFIVNNPDLFAQNYTATPDLPTVARATDEIYQSLGGKPLDGVMYMDPFAVAALLELSGPITVPEIEEQITATNAAEFLLIDQYALYPDRSERADFLGDISGIAFNKLLAAELPSPRRLGDILGPVARQGHLQFWSFDESVQPFLRTVFLDGTFADTVEGDFLSVVHANAAPTKLDTFLQRTVDYDVTVDASTGSLTARVGVTLANSATLDLPSYVLGTSADARNQVHLSIYTPHQIVQATVNGLPIPIELQREYGVARYLTFVTVPAGESLEVMFELEGAVDLSEGTYVLDLANQPLVNDDQTDVRVELLNGRWDASEVTEDPTLFGIPFELMGSTASASFALEQDTRMQLTIN